MGRKAQKQQAPPLKTYVVGGAVRDELLGLQSSDRDWVVVGATPQQMLEHGFKPIGRDFPVFLHPQSKEEYALARSERKSGRGYRGFVFHTAADVTLEEDLRRRDLTINAMARDGKGVLIDPWGGRDDIAARSLRHVSPAFAEDAVRILRVARFAARFHDFSVAPQTLQLMRAMVDDGEVDHLVAERVWQEMARGLMESRPSRMFIILRQCGALAKVMPELDALWGVEQDFDRHPEIDAGAHTMMALDMAARLKSPLAVRFAVLTHDIGKTQTQPPHHTGHAAHSARLTTAICRRLRAPAECRDIARLVARYHPDIDNEAQLRPAARLKVLEACDALRRPQRFEDILNACEANYRGRLGFSEAGYAAGLAWRDAQRAVRRVDAAAIASGCAEPQQIAAAVRKARLAALR